VLKIIEQQQQGFVTEIVEQLLVQIAIGGVVTLLGKQSAGAG
jgi:hypothetical protein